MQQLRINRMGQNMFHAPQTGPSMSPAFIFANDAAQAAPTPPAPAPAPQPAPPVQVAPPVPVAPAAAPMNWKDWAGPVAIVGLVAALVIWNA